MSEYDPEGDMVLPPADAPCYRGEVFQFVVAPPGDPIHGYGAPVFAAPDPALDALMRLADPDGDYRDTYTTGPTC